MTGKPKKREKSPISQGAKVIDHEKPDSSIQMFKENVASIEIGPNSDAEDDPLNKEIKG